MELPIRVAYDVSFLASFYTRTASQSGIYRVVEKLLFALSERADIDLTAAATCGDDPLLSSVHSMLYLKRQEMTLDCGFDPAFKSTLGLTGLYLTAFAAAISEESNGERTTSLSAAYNRRIRGLLYRLHYIYRIDKLPPAFNPRRYDVFHSPFRSLPPQSITKSVPRVITIYDMIAARAPEYFPAHFSRIFRGILDSIDIHRDWVTCISEHTRAEFCEYTGMSPDRSFVTPLAASSAFRHIDDADQIAAVRQRYSVPAGDYFLTLAAPQPRKNLTHLIRCFFRLLDDQPALEANLVLAGSKEQGWLYDEIFDAAESSTKHRQRLIFTGFIADEDLAALYSGALAFVFPSLYEGFGLPPLEAMQCGTPVITSNVTALPEVVGDAGMMVDPHDADALCQALLDIVNDPQLRHDLGRKGLERSKQFTWGKCADETMKVYRAAANEKPR